MFLVHKMTYLIMYSCTCETRQTRRHSPSHLLSTRQTRRHSPKASFEKNVTRLDKLARVIGESREFGGSGHYLVTTHNKMNCQDSSSQSVIL